MGYALGVSVVVDDRHITVSSRNVLKLRHALSVRDRLMHDTVECDTLHTAITLYNMMISKISRNCTTPIWCTTMTNLTPIYRYDVVQQDDCTNIPKLRKLLAGCDPTDALQWLIWLQHTAMTLYNVMIVQIFWNCENQLAVSDPTDALQRLIWHPIYRYDIVQRDDGTNILKLRKPACSVWPNWCSTTTNLTPYIPLWCSATWWPRNFPKLQLPLPVHDMPQCLVGVVSGGGGGGGVRHVCLQRRMSECGAAGGFATARLILKICMCVCVWEGGRER